MIIAPAIASMSQIAVATELHRGQQCISTGMQLKGGEVRFVLSSPSQPVKYASVGKWEKTDFMAPYWWVGDTADSETRNSEIVFESRGGFKLPVIRNTKILRRVNGSRS